MSKHILLTGASGGIGRAMAKALAAQGHRLILVGRNVDKLSALCDALNGEHRYFSCDLTSLSAQQALLNELKPLAPLDLLINNAGINQFSLFDQQSPEALERIIHTNVTATMWLTQGVLPLLANKAQIVVVGSTLGVIGFPGYVSYCAAKFALRGFAEALGRELADRGIEVSYLAPRGTQTELNSAEVIEMNKQLGSKMDPPERVADELLALIKKPQGIRCIGYPEKIFARLNQIFPNIVTGSLVKQLPIIKRFAAAAKASKLKEAV
jgi:short-subunit dehydrogenase